MVDYLYDGSFEGLLTCVYHHYYDDKASGIFTKDEYQPNLLTGFLEVETDEDKAAKVYKAIEEKISSYSLRNIYKAYLSSVPGKEMAILEYIVFGFKHGRATGSFHGRPEVFNLDSIVKKVAVEQERMLQFVRFSVLADNVLYAEIEPDHDVLQLIAGHFCDRFMHDPFIIRDKGRDKALIAYEKQWYVSEFTEADVPQLSTDEIMYRKMWKTYFEHIAIKERKNPRCQRNSMPERYWKHLTELR